MDEKTFSALAAAGLTTGVLMEDGGFSKIHELAEHVAGHPIWTHEFASKTLNEKLRRAVLDAYPDLPTGKLADWRQTAADLIARYPGGLTFARGSMVRESGPIGSLVEILNGKDAAA